MRETYVEISLDNLGNNVLNIRKQYKEYKYFIAVVKSDAYGHGFYIVNELYEKGINYVAVFSIKEALKVREINKDISILCLEPVNVNDIELALNNNITIVVHDFNYLKELCKLDFGGKLKVHMKIDTGMNRLGFKDKTEFKLAYNLIKKSNFLILEGIFTHFASVGIYDKRYDYQVKKFGDILTTIDINSVPIIHTGSSAIMIAHPKLDIFNGVRVGILMYGYNVGYKASNIGLKNKLKNLRNAYYRKRDNISKINCNVNINVKPCMRMFTYIIQIKEVKEGEYVGYGIGGKDTYKLAQDSMVAIIPVGYSNGLLKNNGRYVMINNKHYNVIGEIGMNMSAILVDRSVKLKDKVTVLGDDITLGLFSQYNEVGIAEGLLNVGCNNKRVYIKNKEIIYEEDNI